MKTISFFHLLYVRFFCNYYFFFFIHYLFNLFTYCYMSLYRRFKYTFISYLYIFIYINIARQKSTKTSGGTLPFHFRPSLSLSFFSFLLFILIYYKLFFFFILLTSVLSCQSPTRGQQKKNSALCSRLFFPVLVFVLPRRGFFPESLLFFCDKFSYSWRKVPHDGFPFLNQRVNVTVNIARCKYLCKRK